MSTSQGGPTALKRWMAGEMTKLRERSGRSRAEAAEVVHGSVQGIGHIENGRSLPGPLQLDKLLTFYGVPERTEFFQQLRFRAKKGTDWWIGFDVDSGTLPGYFKLFLGLEAMATRIESWDVQVVPGLFQTRDYAAAVIRSGDPTLSDAEVSSRVELRLARQQEVLHPDRSTLVSSVLDEAALRRVVGGPAVMRAQFDRLLALVQGGHVELRVLPFAVGGHTGTEGPFTLLTYPPEFESDPGTVYSETRVTGIYYESPDEVMRYRDVLTQLRVTSCAPSASVRLIERTAKEF